MFSSKENYHIQIFEIRLLKNDIQFEIRIIICNENRNTQFNAGACSNEQ